MRNASAALTCLAPVCAALVCAALACATVLSWAGCSSDATLATQESTQQQPSLPSGLDSDPSVLSAGGDTTSSAGAPGSGALGEGPGDSPGSAPPASSDEPEPNATETNFFTAGCHVDADCGVGRRCEFAPPESVASDAGLADAGSDGGLVETRPVAPPALTPDAGPVSDAGGGGGPDAAPSEPLGPRGRCVSQ